MPSLSQVGVWLPPVTSEKTHFLFTTYWTPFGPQSLVILPPKYFISAFHSFLSAPPLALTCLSECLLFFSTPNLSTSNPLTQHCPITTGCKPLVLLVYRDTRKGIPSNSSWVPRTSSTAVQLLVFTDAFCRNTTQWCLEKWNFVRKESPLVQPELQSMKYSCCAHPGPFMWGWTYARSGTLNYIFSATKGPHLIAQNTSGYDSASANCPQITIRVII